MKKSETETILSCFDELDAMIRFNKDLKPADKAQMLTLKNHIACKFINRKAKN